MDKFEDAFKKISKVNLATHIELWGEPKTEKLYFEAGQQSRQAEINQLQSQINEMAEVGLSQESVIKEKDKRIEEYKMISESIEDMYLLERKKVEAVEHVLGCAMIAPKEVFQYADRIGRALRGEHE